MPLFLDNATSQVLSRLRPAMLCRWIVITVSSDSQTQRSVRKEGKIEQSAWYPSICNY